MHAHRVPWHINMNQYAALFMKVNPFTTGLGTDEKPKFTAIESSSRLQSVTCDDGTIQQLQFVITIDK
jgi:hypothetical protein